MLGKITACRLLRIMILYNHVRTCMIWMTFISGFAIKAINTVITQWNSYFIKYKSCYSITVTANFTKQMLWYFFFLSNTMDSDVKHGLLDIAG